MEYEIDIERDNDSDILVSVVEGEGHIDVMSDDYHHIDVVNEGAAVTPQVKSFLEHANSLTDIYFGASKLWDVLPHASATLLGGIKVGNYLSIDPVTGVLSGEAGAGTSGNWPLGGDITSQTNLMERLALKAPLESPVFTGDVTMPGTGIWNSSGNVGIGTTTPLNTLQVAGGALFGVNYTGIGAVETKDSAIYLSQPVGAGWQRSVKLSSANDSGYIGLTIDSMDVAAGTGLPSAASLYKNLVYINGYTGNVGIGTTTPSSALCVNGITTLGGSLTFIGAQSITNTTGILTLAPIADLDLTPGGTARVRATSGVRLQSDNYVSQLAGWGISYTGAGDFRYLYADELHAKSFIADLEQALAGGQIISKSVAPLAAIFTVPAAGATATLVVESFKGFDSFKVFVDGDIVRLRQFDRTGTSLNIVNCWGTVVWVSTDTTNKTQTYTFTRSSGGNAGGATTSSTIAAGALVLDYGTTGNGFLESNAIDGAMAENAPYHQIVSWTTHPASTTPGEGLLPRTRLGNLHGLFNISNEYGLYAGNGVVASSQYLRISDQAIEGHNLTIKLYDGAVNTVLLSPTAPSFAMGATLPTGFLVGNGIWMGKDSTAYKMRVGSVSGGVLGEGFSWDGTTFTIKGTVMATAGLIGGWAINSTYLAKDTGTDATSAGLAPLDYPFYAGKQYASRASAPFSVTKAGALKATLGTIGGFTITATDLYAGSGATRVEMQAAGGFWAGDNSFASAPFSVSPAGILKAENAEIRGKIIYKYTLNYDVLHLNSTVRATNSASYTELKWIILGSDIPPSGLMLKIDFALASGNASGHAYDIVYAKIYKNGVAIGSEYSQSTNAWVTWNEDLGPFYSGDRISIYGYSNYVLTNCNVKDLTIMGSHSAAVNEVTATDGN